MLVGSTLNKMELPIHIRKRMNMPSNSMYNSANGYISGTIAGDDSGGGQSLDTNIIQIYDFYLECPAVSYQLQDARPPATTGAGGMWYRVDDPAYQGCSFDTGDAVMVNTGEVLEVLWTAQTLSVDANFTEPFLINRWDLFQHQLQICQWQPSDITMPNETELKNGMRHYWSASPSKEDVAWQWRNFAFQDRQSVFPRPSTLISPSVSWQIRETFVNESPIILNKSNVLRWNTIFWSQTAQRPVIIQGLFIKRII